MQKAKKDVGEIADLNIAKAAELIRSCALSPIELVRACLARIEARNAECNAFITVMADEALEQARKSESEISAGNWRGPLHGIPIAIKDLVDIAGVRTTAGSAVFEHRVAEQDAEVTRRLKQAGAVLIGKTNLHEFAYGGSSLVSYFGPVRNARNPEYIAGGSSGGSAVAVAAGMCLGAIGTDTAGSIREPASLCGIVGLKPSYGRVSTRGVVPLAWSYDHVGPMTRTVEDAGLLLDAIAGYDPPDVNSKEFFAGPNAGGPGRDGGKLQFGIAREMFYDDLDAEVGRVMDACLRKLAGGNELVEVSIPLDPDRRVASCESYVFHAEYIANSAAQYQPSTLERIRTGEQVTAGEYIRGKQRLEQMRRTAIEVFDKVDVVITPTVPVPATRIAELEAEPQRLRERELIMLRNTRPFNVLGWPTVSIPCGESSEGLPIGVQLATAPGTDAALIDIAQQLERWLRKS